MKRKARRPQVKGGEGLVIRSGNGAPLSRAQMEFNRLMKSLETTKASHAREQARLDDALATSICELMPLVENLNRVTRDLVTTGMKALKTLKLTGRRRDSFGDLLAGKADDLLADPVGLTDEEIAMLVALTAELAPPGDEEKRKEAEAEEFHHVRTMMEQVARQAGIDLDLGDLDPHGDPGEFERMASERLRDAFAALENAGKSPTNSTKRKPTKAQLASEQKRLAIEEAKNRDLKSLFKQLAKAFHPDLEPDPVLKKHKVVWMQRLNSAYSSNDLREMLQLEMEWLGEEATNLATAGDDKLKVYCIVLKEQIASLKRQTHDLSFEPQYGPLQRFRDPYFGTLASPVTIKRDLNYELRRHREMLEVLSANNAASRKMIYEWADANARRRGPDF
jgi:hypothetical protein